MRVPVQQRGGPKVPSAKGFCLSRYHRIWPIGETMERNATMTCLILLRRHVRSIRRQILAVVLMVAFCTTAAAERPAAAGHYPLATLAQAYATAGFDAAAKNAVVFVAASDVHYGYCDEEGMLPIIREVNAMMPRPAFFVITGDLICSASIAFGNRPDGKQKAKAVEEFCLFKKHLDSVSPAIPVRLVLGNHDTYPGEVEPELFHRVFPDRPAYQSFDVAGVHFVALNGHSTGYIDGQQRDWLTADIARVPTGRTIVTFVHQPALQSTVAERDLPGGWPGICRPDRRVVASCRSHPRQCGCRFRATEDNDRASEYL